MPARPWRDHRDTAPPAGHCPGGCRGPGSLPKYGGARPKHCSEGRPNKSASCRSLKVSSGPSGANPIGESARSDVTMSESSAPVIRGGGMDVSALNCSTPPELFVAPPDGAGLPPGPRGPRSIGERPRFSVVEDTEPTCCRGLRGPGKSRLMTPLRGTPGERRR